MHVRLGFRRDDSFRQPSSVVLREAVLPLEKVGDGLRFNADFNPAQAGQEKVHLPYESLVGALALAAGLDRQLDLPALALQESPL